MKAASSMKATDLQRPVTNHTGGVVEAVGALFELLGLLSWQRLCRRPEVSPSLLAAAGPCKARSRSTSLSSAAIPRYLVFVQPLFEFADLARYLDDNSVFGTP